MNLFQKIGLALKARKILKEAEREVKTMDGIKPGWKTTEFWGKTVVQGVVIYNTFATNDIKPELALQMVGAIEGLYHGLRALVKIAKELKEAFKKPDAIKS